MELDWTRKERKRKIPLKEKERKFEEFRSEYPEKKSKVKAKAIFIKIIDNVPTSKIIEWLRGYKSDHVKKEKAWEFVPPYKYPTTRLNQWCRDDEYTIKEDTRDEEQRLKEYDNLADNRYEKFKIKYWMEKYREIKKIYYTKSREAILSTKKA